jgi:hypothetical protein
MVNTRVTALLDTRTFIQNHLEFDHYQFNFVFISSSNDTDKATFILKIITEKSLFKLLEEIYQQALILSLLFND